MTAAGRRKLLFFPDGEPESFSAGFICNYPLGLAGYLVAAWPG